MMVIGGLNLEKKLLNFFLKKKLKKKNIEILDFGCGVGINFKMLSEFGTVYYYDQNKDIVNQNKKRFNSNNFKHINKLKKSTKKFDLIVALDVIEHIEDDKKIIKILSNKLKKNGKILITVPAYNFLFSSKDIDLEHKRRYNMKSIVSILRKYFIIEKKTYFNFFLAPLIAASIILLNFLSFKFIDKVEKKPNIIINLIFKKIFTFEKYLIGFMTLPFGISIFIYGKKKN